jgi:hypothetical protein
MFADQVGNNGSVSTDPNGTSATRGSSDSLTAGPKTIVISITMDWITFWLRLIADNTDLDPSPTIDRYARPMSKFKFYSGCFLAFLSGFLTMFNNFLIKGTGSDFGELLTTRGLLQISLMFIWIKVKGEKETFFAHYIPYVLKNSD